MHKNLKLQLYTRQEDTPWMVCKSPGWWSSNISCYALLPHLRCMVPSCMPGWKSAMKGWRPWEGTTSICVPRLDLDLWFVHQGRQAPSKQTISGKDASSQKEPQQVGKNWLICVRAFKLNYNELNMNFIAIWYNIWYIILEIVLYTEQDGSYTTTDRP